MRSNAHETTSSAVPFPRGRGRGEGKGTGEVTSWALPSGCATVGGLPAHAIPFALAIERVLSDSRLADELARNGSRCVEAYG